MTDEYVGPERRANDRALAAVRMELAQVRAAMSAATEDLVTQESLNRTAKRAATRLLTAYVLFALCVVFAASFLYTGQQRLTTIAKDARVASEAAKTSADTLNDCLVVGGHCYQDLAVKGTQGSVRQMKFLSCVLTTPIERRSVEVMIACGKAAYPEITNLDQQLREAVR